MTQSPTARVEIRWDAAGFSYNNTVGVPLAENSTVAPSLAAPSPIARAAPAREVGP